MTKWEDNIEQYHKWKGKDTDTPSTTGSSKNWKACYHDHKPLPLGDGLFIYGGSCINPTVADADVYIGFDSGMKFTAKHYPWVPGHEIQMIVTDRDVPKSLGDFQQLIDWTIKQIKAGKKVHAGCIGGHGRTGTFFAALVATMMGRTDAGQYVRDNYCSKAIESKTQVEWLQKYFGVEPVKPRDAEKLHSSAKSGHTYSSGYGSKSTGIVAKPVRGVKGCIFGDWI